MQVGLALNINDFKDDLRLQKASYGFSVFSMVLIAAAVGLAVMLFTADLQLTEDGRYITNYSNSKQQMDAQASRTA
jgi:hypothetical protein